MDVSIKLLINDKHQIRNVTIFLLHELMTRDCIFFFFISDSRSEDSWRGKSWHFVFHVYHLSVIVCLCASCWLCLVHIIHLCVNAANFLYVYFLHKQTLNFWCHGESILHNAPDKVVGSIIQKRVTHGHLWVHFEWQTFLLY